jgi:membrane protein YdbS with pleckstrin-like domain
MADPFSNEPIRVEHLPQLSDDAFVSVDRRYVWGSLAWLAGAIVVVIGVAVVIVVASGNVVVPLVVAGGIVALLVAAVVTLVLESRRLAYQLREHDVSLRSGVIEHRVETIPFSRIQHVSVGRGLFERWLGLATLQVSSAGPDISVPGLSVSDADRIKQVVAERAGVDEAPDDASVDTPPDAPDDPSDDAPPALLPPSWPAP